MDKKVIHKVFEEIVKKYPLRTAIETEGGSIFYSGLNAYANRIAHLLEAIGCGSGTIVNVIAPSSIELVGAMLAVFKKGGIFLPVDPGFSEKRLRQIFKDTFDGIVITTTGLYDHFVALAAELDIRPEHIIVIGNSRDILLQCIDNGRPANVPVEEKPEWECDLAWEVKGNDSNYIYYTSGSTGEGKAIVGAHASLSHFIHWEIKEFRIDESFRVSQLTPVTFDASLRDIFVALISGGTLCIPPANARNDYAMLVRWLENAKIGLVHCVPSVFRMITRELQSGKGESHDLSHLKYILMAGELLYAKDIGIWREVAGETIGLVNLYGATETTLIKTFYRIDQVPENPTHVIPVGKPISNTIVAIIKDGHIGKVGEIGEIYIKTPFMTKGYYKNEALTSECFVQNPLVLDVRDIVYKTGDLGRYLPDGNMEVLGRLDSQVKVNGIRVELIEVEQALLELGNMTGAIVKAHRTDDNLLTLIAYYTGEPVGAEELRDSLGKVLNSQIIPSYFIHLNEFPLNINGKIDKKALPLPEDVIMRDMSAEPPVGVLENKVAEFWREILGLKQIGRNVSFFVAGGHSLRAIQLISRIQKDFGVSLKIADVFTHRTIRELAHFIANAIPEGSNVIPIDPVHLQPHYPLSSSQHRLWVLCQSEETSITYNMSGAYVFEGDLDPEALEYSFKALLERHEILRTVFGENENGGIRQFIRAPEDMAFRISFNDLRQEPVQEAMIIALLKSAAAQPFDLSAGPLLRAGLYRTAHRKWVFTCIVHHIISDGWSMNILIKELLLSYNARTRGDASPLPPLRIQYKDYAAWQQEQLNGTRFNEHKAYWLKQFEGDLPVISLRAGKTRPPAKTYNGGIIKRRIGPALTTGFRSLVQTYDVTFFMGLLAAVDVLLYRNSQQEDIILGSPIAGREHIDLESQIGFYLNTLALRTKITKESPYTELLRQVKEVTLGAYEHQAYPFDLLIDTLNISWDPGRNALFDVWIVLHNAKVFDDRKEQNLGELKVSMYEWSENLHTKFDLLFHFIEAGEELQVMIEFNTDIIDRKYAGDLGMQLEEIINYVIKDPGTKIREISEYLDKVEQETMEEHLQMIRDRNLMKLKNY